MREGLAAAAKIDSENHRSPTRNTPQPRAFRGTDAKEFPIFKQMGRNNFQFFTQAMNDAAQQRLLMENDLRHALERGEFTLHYQPLLDLGSGAITGFEDALHCQRAKPRKREVASIM